MVTPNTLREFAETCGYKWSVDECERKYLHYLSGLDEGDKQYRQGGLEGAWEMAFHLHNYFAIIGHKADRNISLHNWIVFVDMLEGRMANFFEVFDELKEIGLEGSEGKEWEGLNETKWRLSFWDRHHTYIFGCSMFDVRR